ncbi:MAG: ribonuclease E inhibitor RraB [Caulobacteraceae bacterium]|nr:MAG: ribonuclease E inhibitor RraB [Caulobacteraceae bacterium]
MPQPSPEQAAKDAAVRMSLLSHGDQGTASRHTLFYFYGGNHRGLGRAAEAAGFKAGPTVSLDWVILETTMAVDPPSFAPTSARMEAWAEEFGCRYDGWECAVVVN